ncbi:hypothetical protein SAMN05216349_108125 [Oribacterium sp. KHPX15]|uniref:hypothetical protein n=1 Tax=Oribacterium sp. KHPX15 TaxID=1855342 RepID=UPI000894DA30|nr:hypothetical protein [Oribacterium sp. KHPX15]SEA29263.1 hypothetical protein SAMN05216349_108125 [Oribacterium sp. KHPX15]
MFLNSMNSDEKEAFLELAYKLAQVDGNYSKDEEDIINSYKAELNIKNVGDTRSVDELIDFFATRNEPVKKIILFELYGMICADSKIEKSETEMFDKLKSKFDVSDEIIKRITEVADELQTVYDKLYDVLA